MDRHRIDLSPLDPAHDPARWDRRVRSIMAHAAPELARRAAAQRSVLTVLAGWARPALAAALILVALSGAVVGFANRLAPAPTAAAPDVAEALTVNVLGGPELPELLAALLRAEQPPAVFDLMALEDESR